MTNSTPTLHVSRGAALKQWEAVVASVAKPNQAMSVESSGLLAALRYRLIHEAEGAASLLSSHPTSRVDKVLRDLVTRTYWRGWSEGRPQVYLSYLRSRDDDGRRFTGTQTLAIALEGRTGLVAFDEWNEQMISTGWLPQQARLWYASIWIFTLRLPWSLGAAHMASHLIASDPASEVIQWRWVAGLNPPSKPYVAKAAEISKWSEGRYDLTGHLHESPAALTGPALPPARLQELPAVPSAALGEQYALLVTPDDLSPEASAIGLLKPRLILTSGFQNLDKNTIWGSPVIDYVEAALNDTAERLRQHFDCPVEPLTSTPQVGDLVGERLRSEGIPHLVYHQPALGPWQEMVSRMTAKDVGLKYFPLRRPWDSKFWPSAGRTLIDFFEAVKPGLLKP